MRITRRTAHAIMLVTLLVGCGKAAPAYDLLLTGGTVIDGTGAPRRVADVAITGDRVVAIGAALPRARAARVVDVTGRIVAPGFWDNHAHLVTLADHPQAENFVRQGITTVLRRCIRRTRSSRWIRIGHAFAWRPTWGCLRGTPGYGSV